MPWLKFTRVMFIEQVGDKDSSVFLLSLKFCKLQTTTKSKCSDYIDVQSMDNFKIMSAQSSTWADNMGNKTEWKRRRVTISTVEKWKRESDKMLNTTVWLSYNKLDHNHMVFLKCTVCIQFKDKINSCRNFNPAFIEDSKNLCASSYKDHTATDMHK